MAPDLSEIKKYTFLVTGGGGFIGSNLVQRLLDLGAKKVVVLDNFSNGFRKNLAVFHNNPAFELIDGDIRDLDTCRNACRGIDMVSHQAALGSVPRSLDDPLTTNEVNVAGFLNMMMAAKENQVKRFVYAASSSTYGDSLALPKREDVIGKPLSPYAVTKYVNELYASVFAFNYGFESIGLRYFNVFGPKQDPGGAYAAVIPLFIQALIEGRSPSINGDGSQTRDFTYIDNAVDANLCALLTQNKNAVNQVYNVAVGERVSVKEMFGILESVEGKGIKPVYREARNADVKDSLADISKARELIGYEPKVNFREGLKMTYEWFLKNQEFIAAKD